MKDFKITKSGDVIDKLFIYRDKYHERGKYLGFKNLHDHYSMMLGNCTDWSGFPMSGKTQFLMECLLNTSKFYGWKHLVYFPDVGNQVEIIADLIHKVTGKTFDPEKINAIQDHEIVKSIDWITEHFKVLTKRNVKAKLSPYQFWDYAVELKKSEGLQTASIDSWKDMYHDTSRFARDDKYLEDVLSYRNHIAENNELHLHTIIHPKLTEKENGIRKSPNPYDLKGGSEWINNGKNMITIHREDITNNHVDVYFHKIKPRSNGNVGRIQMFFDINKFVYYDEIGINREKVFAQKQ